MNIRKIGGKVGRAIKTVGYDIPKMVVKGTVRKAFTNANITDNFPDMKKKKRVMSSDGYMLKK